MINLKRTNCHLARAQSLRTRSQGLEKTHRRHPRNTRQPEPLPARRKIHHRGTRRQRIRILGLSLGLLCSIPSRSHSCQTAWHRHPATSRRTPLPANPFPRCRMLTQSPRNASPKSSPKPAKNHPPKSTPTSSPSPPTNAPPGSEWFSEPGDIPYPASVIEPAIHHHCRDPPATASRPDVKGRWQTSISGSQSPPQTSQHISRLSPRISTKHSRTLIWIRPADFAPGLQDHGDHSTSPISRKPTESNQTRRFQR